MRCEDCDKVDYKSEATALKAAASMEKKTGEKYDAYECGSGGWHIGHTQKYHGDGEVTWSLGRRVQTITEKDGTKIINVFVSPQPD